MLSVGFLQGGWGYRIAGVSAGPIFRKDSVRGVYDCCGLGGRGVIGFNTGIGPLKLSPGTNETVTRRISVLSSCPSERCASLQGAVSDCYGVPTSFVLPKGNSDRLVSLLVRRHTPGRALVLKPACSRCSERLSFSKDARRCCRLRRDGSFRPSVPSLYQGLRRNCSFLVLYGPGGPASSTVARRRLHELVNFYTRGGVFIVVSRACIRFTPSVGTVATIPLAQRFAGLVMLHNMSGFFTTPKVHLNCNVAKGVSFLTGVHRGRAP